MKVRALHKDLDTGFVNLSALLKYLQQRGFVGLVRVDLDEYRAEIIFDESKRVKLREFEHGSGRIVETHGALQRLLVRARLAGGIINVYQAVMQMRPKPEEMELGDILDLDQKAAQKAARKTAPESPTANPPTNSAANPASKIPKPAENIFAVAKNGKTNGNGNSANGFYFESPYSNGNAAHDAAQDAAPPQADEEIFPLYSHPVDVVEEQPEMKKKVSAFSLADWEELIGVTAALLGTTDDILRSAHLGFPDAFNKARVEVSNEFPFLHTGKNIFLYADGKVILKEEIPPNLFVAGISECLRRILNKLVSNPKFFAVYKRVTQQILILVRRQQPQFDKFGYTRQLERIIKF